MKELKIMKALRYLLITMAVLSVLSVSAKTAQYGKTYTPRVEHAAYNAQVSSQMPIATMSSTSSEFMVSGSTLPQAAVTGTTTTYSAGHHGHIRRGWGSGGEEGEPGSDRPEPYETPLDDVLWPLMLFAGVYALMRVFLIVKRKKFISRGVEMRETGH